MCIYIVKKKDDIGMFVNVAAAAVAVVLVLGLCWDAPKLPHTGTCIPEQQKKAADKRRKTRSSGNSKANKNLPLPKQHITLPTGNFPNNIYIYYVCVVVYCFFVCVSVCVTQ